MEFDYNLITDKQFDEELENIVGNLSTSAILSYGEVNSFFREHFNNDVLKECKYEAFNKYVRTLNKRIKQLNLSHAKLVGRIFCFHDDVEDICLKIANDNEFYYIWIALCTDELEDDKFTIYVHDGKPSLDVTVPDGTSVGEIDAEYVLTFNWAEDVNNFYKTIGNNINKIETLIKESAILK